MSDPTKDLAAPYTTALESIEKLLGEIDRLEAVLQNICIKCRSNPWGPATPRKEILNWMHDTASAGLADIDPPDTRNQKEPENGIA